jgi:thiamine-phosphate pyrophosphorylase
LLLYYITDRTQFPGDESVRRRRVLEKIAEAARYGVDYVQLREKDLPTRELEALAREAVQTIRHNSPRPTANREPTTRLLVNSRTDLALAVGADGVHLRSEDISPSVVQSIWTQGRRGPMARAVVGVSCHCLAQVARAASEGADFVVFAPTFEKKFSHRNSPDARPAGLNGVRQASQQNILILALGGITLANAGASLDAGAAGIAGIRLFQENAIRKVVEVLRSSARHPTPSNPSAPQGRMW